MSTTYSTIGQAIYDFMDSIDISAATPENWEPGENLTWGDKLNRPPKANELNVYPAFLVMPSGDTQETGDSRTDLDAVTYSVFVVFSYAEATYAEDTLRHVADIVRTAFRALRLDPSQLMNSAYHISFTGEWGGTVDQGERYYKLNITTQITEDIS